MQLDVEFRVVNLPSIGPLTERQFVVWNISSKIWEALPILFDPVSLGNRTVLRYNRHSKSFVK
jgi:hypothetical protein